MALDREQERAEALERLKKQLSTRIDKTAEATGLVISDDTKALLINETTSLTHSPKRAALIIDRVLETQGKLPSLHDPELLKERIGYAFELVTPSAPDYPIKADSHSSKVISGKAGSSRGFAREN